MISIEYFVADGTSAPYWPAVIRKTSNDGTVISEEAVGVVEAELAGVDVDLYISAYKSYIQSYLDSLTTFSEESALSQMDSHMNAQSAVKYFQFFMQAKWQVEP